MIWILPNFVDVKISKYFIIEGEGRNMERIAKAIEEMGNYNDSDVIAQLKEIERSLDQIAENMDDMTKELKRGNDMRQEKRESKRSRK